MQDPVSISVLDINEQQNSILHILITKNATLLRTFNQHQYETCYEKESQNNSKQKGSATRDSKSSDEW